MFGTRSVSSLLAFVAYTGVSLLLFGRGVIGDIDDRVIGDAGSDKTIFMWALEWWPRALADGRDPFSAHVVWAPRGMDLAWVAAIPGAAYLAAPMTYVAGPVVAYNVAVLLAPATAAWGAFLLARRITASLGPAFVGGLLFGFSSFEIGQTIGHLHLTIVVAIPLAALLVVRRFEDDLSNRLFVVLLTLVLGAQFLISTEVFLMLLGMGVVTLALAWWILERDSRPRLREVTREVLIALCATAVVLSPYLVHAFLLTGPSWAPTRDPFAASADLANFVVPRRWTWLRPPGSDELAERFTANPVESTAYLGLPLLVIIAIFASKRGRPRPHILLLALLATTVLFSLGPWIRVAGTTIAPGPGQALAHVPVADSALPVRLTLFVSLYCGLVCALWLAERRSSALRWALVLLALVALLPTPSMAFWTADVERSQFFAGSRAEARFDPDDIVLVLPYGRSGWSMLWQAESAFAYRMAGGRLGNLPPEEQRWLPVLRTLAGAPVTDEAAEQLPEFLRAHDVDAIVVVPRQVPNRLKRLVSRLGIEPIRDEDALVYELTTPRG